MLLLGKIILIQGINSISPIWAIKYISKVSMEFL